MNYEQIAKMRKALVDIGDLMLRTSVQVEVWEYLQTVEDVLTGELSHMLVNVGVEDLVNDYNNGRINLGQLALGISARIDGLK